MQNTIVHQEGAASLETARTKIKLCASIIKIGLDVHARIYVAVAQYDQLLPKPARRLAPSEFVPWVRQLVRAGHVVYVVYEACGFGFGLYRNLQAAGAHCYVIAPRKLDEQCTRVKTDPRDATTLCQRLSRHVEGNTRELAVIREEQARHVFTAARTVGATSTEAGGPRAQFAGWSQSALTGALVKESDLVAFK